MRAMAAFVANGAIETRVNPVCEGVLCKLKRSLQTQYHEITPVRM